MHKYSYYIFSFVVGLFGGSCGVILAHEHTALEQLLLPHHTTPVTQQVVKTGTNSITNAVEEAIHIWRPIQEKVQDTVVQIFVQVAAIDLLQPYKTPAQGAAYGSGFFISDTGLLVTNAHVVNQATAIWIQIPSLGKQIIDVKVVGMSPERDLALLQVTEQGLKVIKEELGTIPYLTLGNSDEIWRADEVMALGYPLGQHALKSTTGIISGPERHLIQISAPINPGSSGGPLLNTRGEVIGINCSGITEAQNVGYAIPINELKIILKDLTKQPILRKPYLGVLFNNASPALTQYLKNPLPGGCYVAGIVEGSPLEKAGVMQGDMIYEINGYAVDIFGEMKVPWSEDKISIIDYVGRLTLGQEITMVIYRQGVRKDITITFDLSKLPAIRKVYPGYEVIDYEVFGGIVIMELTINHIQLLIDQASGLASFAEIKNQSTPVLLITHILPNSQAYRSRALMVGMTLQKINDMKVNTLADLRAALKKGANTPFLTIVATDNVARISDHVFVVLEYDKILAEEPKLSQDFRYPLSATTKNLIKARSITSNEKANNNSH